MDFEKEEQLASETEELVSKENASTEEFSAEQSDVADGEKTVDMEAAFDAFARLVEQDDAKEEVPAETVDDAFQAFEVLEKMEESGKAEASQETIEEEKSAELAAALDAFAKLIEQDAFSTEEETAHEEPVEEEEAPEAVEEEEEPVEEEEEPVEEDESVEEEEEPVEEEEEPVEEEEEPVEEEEEPVEEEEEPVEEDESVDEEEEPVEEEVPPVVLFDEEEAVPEPEELEEAPEPVEETVEEEPEEAAERISPVAIFDEEEEAVSELEELEEAPEAAEATVEEEPEEAAERIPPVVLFDEEEEAVSEPEELEEAPEAVEEIVEEEEPTVVKTVDEEEPVEEPERKKKKKGGIWRKLIIVLIILLVLTVLLVGATYGVFRHYYGKLNHRSANHFETVSEIDLDDDYDESVSDSDEKDIHALDEYVLNNLSDGEEELQFDDKNVTNILLIGTDNRGQSSAHCRSDSMIILSINRNTKKVVMTSVMRDIYAAIPGHGNTRINAAYAYGGPKLLFSTLETNFKIPIDKYVQVDFYSFMDVVDAVGGVDMYVSQAEIKVMNRIYIDELNKNLGLPRDLDKIKESDAGWLHLNGKQAVAYSRVRYVGNADFGRTERQRKVLTEIIKKSKKLSVKEMDQLANIILPKVTTNLSQGEVFSLLVGAPEYLNYEVVSARMPVDGSYRYMTVRKMSVLGVDFAKNRKYWYNTVYGE